MMRLLLVLVWTLSTSVHAISYVSHNFNNGVLSIQSDEYEIVVRAKSSHALEVLHKVDSQAPLPSFALLADASFAQLVLKAQPDKLLLDTGVIQAEISLPDLQFRFLKQGQLLIEEQSGAFAYTSMRGFRFALQPDEKLMGAGERVLGMDRRGHRMPLYNKAHYGYSTESKQMYFGLSAVMSNRHYALIFDNSAKGNLDIGHTQDDVLQFDAVAGRLAYVVVAGDDYPDLIGQFTQITGRQPLPPRWALGNFASRFGYHSEQETRDTVQKMIDADFPLDAVVLDLYWFGSEVKGMMGNLEWDKEHFPNPQQMIKDFKQQGVETILITEPFVLTTSNKWQDATDNNALANGLDGTPKRFDFYFGNSGLIDVFSRAGRDWFKQVYVKLAEQGVSGWWGDLGEPEVHPYDTLHNFDGRTVSADEIHNAYGHQWAKMLYQTHLDTLATRPMILMRSGFVGSQRYGMIPWTGDVSRSWGGLKPQVELSLQMSMLGLAYTHSDLGGFAGGERFDPELYIRWMQYGVFQPVYRPHAQEDIAPEPVFHDQQTQHIVRQFIKLRYALLPYNYSLAYQNTMTGMPLMRPMAFEDETNGQYFDMADQYLWGDAFLVKPVTDPAIQETAVVLPKGAWFDYWSDEVFQGNNTLQVSTPLEQIPLFVRAGAFIPMSRPMQHTKLYDAGQLDIHYYHHDSVKQAKYTLYDDDGKSRDTVQAQRYQQIEFEQASKDNSTVFSIQVKGQYRGAPARHDMTLIIHNWTQSPHDTSVFVNNKLLANTDAAQSKSLFYHIDEVQKTLTIAFAVKERAVIKINR